MKESVPEAGSGVLAKWVVQAQARMVEFIESELTRARAEWERERPVVEKEPEVEGLWRCPTCEYQLSKAWISPDLMKVAVNKSDDAELCPNDGARLVPLTYKEQVANMEKYIQGMFKERDELRAQLAEREARNTEQLTIPVEEHLACEKDHVAVIMEQNETINSLQGELAAARNVAPNEPASWHPTDMLPGAI